MRRRQLVAGIGSAAVVGGAGLFAAGATPSVFDSNDGGTGGTTGSDGDTDKGGDETEVIEPMTIETIDAPGSRDDEVTVPATEQPTFVDFFGTWCPPCAEQMPSLGTASDRVGDDVRFISVTTEAVGRSVTESEIADWWIENDGDWLVGADPTAELAAKLNVSAYPTAVVLDVSGRIQWSESGVHTADELVTEIERVLDR